MPCFRRGGAAAQASYCWANGTAATTIPNQRAPFTVIGWNQLTISDTQFFVVSPSRANAVRILQGGLYRVAASAREIFASPASTVPGPRQLFPVYTPAGPVSMDRFWGADPDTSNQTKVEYAADNAWTGVPTPAGLNPFGDPVTLAEWETRYVAWVQIDPASVSLPVDLQWKYRQLSGASRTLTALCRQMVMRIPSDVDDKPASFGTVQHF